MKHAISLLLLLSLVSAAGRATGQDLQDGLIGHWAMDGAVIDASGNGLDGQIVGSLSYVPDRNGTPAGAIEGFSTADYLFVAHNQALLPNSAYSAGGFFRFDNAGFSGGQTLFSKSEGIDYALRISNGVMDNLAMSHNVSSLGPGSWHHIMVTWDGSTMRMWINGSVVESAAVAGPIGGFGMPLSLGIELPEFSGGPYNPFQGAIDDFRFYNRALTTLEVQILAGLNVNQAPVAAFTVDPTTGPAPLEVDLDGLGSSDPNGDLLTYTWDLGDGAQATGSTVSHQYLAEATYTISLTVADPAGLQDTATGQLVVTANAPPVADFSFIPRGTQRPLEVFFDASASADTPGDALTFAWDFGDGSVGTGETVDHTFNSVVGDTPVVLTVTDSGGLSTSTTKNVTVPNRRPSARFTVVPETGMQPLEVTVTSSSSDPDGDTITHAWDFGDGATATGITAVHTYANEGRFTITLTVEDQFGASSTGPGTVDVLRFNTAPTVVLTATPSSGQAPLLVTLDASGTTDAENDAVSFAWDLGDGATASGEIVEHTYNVAGTVTATVTATDALGMVDTGTVEITLRVPENTVVSSSSGGAWSDPGTWVGGSAPSPANLVLITTGVTGARQCAGITIEASGTWTPNGSITITGDITNRGDVAAAGHVIQVQGDLRNEGSWSSSAIVAGTLRNQGTWSGSTIISGDLINSGVWDGGTVVSGNLTNQNQLEAGGEPVRAAGNVQNGGEWTNAPLVLDGTGEQWIGHSDGSPLGSPITIGGSSGKRSDQRVIRASTNLEIVADLNLGGQLLDLGDLHLTFGEGAWPRDGRIATGGTIRFLADGMIAKDVTFNADLRLSQTHTLRGTVVVEGDLVIDGTLDDERQDWSLSVTGSVTNNGVLNATSTGNEVTIGGALTNRGTWRITTTSVAGSITDIGVLDATYFHLNGSEDRTIRLGNTFVSVDRDASFRLLGQNRLPELGGLRESLNNRVEIAAGATVTLATGASRGLRSLDPQVTNSGTVFTRQTWTATKSSPYGSVYRTRVQLPRTSQIDSVDVRHQSAVPSNFADAARSLWTISAYPDDGVKRYFSALIFVVPDEVLNGHRFDDLVVLHSSDNRQTWDLLSTVSNTTRNESAQSIMLETAPAWGEYIMTSRVESAVVRKTIAWSLVGSEIPIWGRRGARNFYLRMTNDTPVSSDAFLVTLGAQGRVQFDTFASAALGGGTGPVVTVEDQAAGSTRDIYLYVNGMGPGESRQLNLRVWSDGSFANKTGEADGLFGSALLGTTKAPAGAMAKAFLTDAVYHALFTMYGAQFEGECDDLWKLTKAWFDDAFSNTTRRYGSGNVPVSDIVLDLGKDILQKSKGISLVGVEASEFLGKALTRFAEGVRTGVAGEQIPTCTGSGCFCDGPECRCSGSERAYSACAGPDCGCAGVDCVCPEGESCITGVETSTCTGDGCQCKPGFAGCAFSGPDTAFLSLHSDFSVPEGDWYCPQGPAGVDCDNQVYDVTGGGTATRCEGIGCRCDGPNCPLTTEYLGNEISGSCFGPDCACEGKSCECTVEAEENGLCTMAAIPNCEGDGCDCTGPLCWTMLKSGGDESDMIRAQCEGPNCACEGNDVSCSDAGNCKESTGDYVIKCGDTESAGGDDSANPGDLQTSDVSDFLTPLRAVFAWDPNDKSGPTGVGEPGYLSNASCMDYLIRFENKAEASAAAFAIVIVDTLDVTLDPSTIEMTDASSDLFTMSVDGNVVTFEASGILLPPNVNAPEGEGYVAFSVDTADDLPNGTEIRNAATITFDFNEPIQTNTAVNTLDFQSPTTTMRSLPEHIVGDSLTVAWFADDSGASGVKSTAVYQSIDEGPFELVGTSDGDSLRIGAAPGHNYAYYALSQDRVGNTERQKPDPVYVLVTGVGVEDEIPSTFELSQNYPNPFNPRTTITFALPESGETQLAVFDILGRRVAVLLDGPQEAGPHHVVWDASGMASGVYLYRLEIGSQTATRSMILLR
jgi:PKD repeat protein